MSAVAGAQQLPLQLHPVARWWSAWSRLNWHHLAGLGLASLLMALVDMSVVADKLDKPGVGAIVAFDLFAAAVLFSIALLAWSAAVEGHAPAGPARQRALIKAVLLTGLLSAAIVVPVGHTAGISEIWWELYGKKKALPPMWLGIVANTIHLGLFGLLFMLVAEALQRRAANGAAMLLAQREQAAIAREVLESRLAAMQAQVEPQFLFNSLVDIEALYRKDATAAAQNLDHLIQYLRVALPRLREPGSTIAAELELVRAYLAVVTALHDGRPALTITGGDGCAEARLYPMLLLPLVQRAVRSAEGLPESIRIGVQRVDQQIVVVVRIAAGGGCSDDPELVRVRERLVGLYGDRAVLDCAELEPATTQFTLRIPAEPGRATG
jgi:hypothetical protein